MKKCDICRKHKAVVKVRRVGADGATIEIDICADCAREQGLTEAELQKNDMTQIWADVQSTKTSSLDQKLLCTNCGLSWVQFKRTGRLGCATCYDAFCEKLEPIIRRLHNAVQHVGKAPAEGRTEARKRLSKKQLAAELARAIEQENYELAAVLRDQLKKIDQDDAS